MTVGRKGHHLGIISQATLQNSVRPCPDFLEKISSFAHSNFQVFCFGVEDAMLRGQEDRSDKKLFVTRMTRTVETAIAATGTNKVRSSKSLVYLLRRNEMGQRGLGALLKGARSRTLYNKVAMLKTQPPRLLHCATYAHAAKPLMTRLRHQLTRFWARRLYYGHLGELLHVSHCTGQKRAREAQAAARIRNHSTTVRNQHIYASIPRTAADRATPQSLLGTTRPRASVLPWVQSLWRDVQQPYRLCV